MSMSHVNQAVLRGSVTQIFPSEKVVKLTVCTAKDYWTNEGEKKTQFSYVPCVAFGHEANRIKSAGTEKGDLVTILASINQNSYEKDGKKIYTTNIVVESFDLSKKKDGNGAKKASLSDEVSIDNTPF